MNEPFYLSAMLLNEWSKSIRSEKFTIFVCLTCIIKRSLHLQYFCFQRKATSPHSPSLRTTTLPSTLLRPIFLHRILDQPPWKFFTMLLQKLPFTSCVNWIDGGETAIGHQDSFFVRLFWDGKENSRVKLTSRLKLEW